MGAITASPPANAAVIAEPAKRVEAFNADPRVVKMLEDLQTASLGWIETLRRLEGVVDDVGTEEHKRRLGAELEWRQRSEERQDVLKGLIGRCVEKGEIYQDARDALHEWPGEGLTRIDLDVGRAVELFVKFGNIELHNIGIRVAEVEELNGELSRLGETGQKGEVGTVQTQLPSEAAVGA